MIRRWGKTIRPDSIQDLVQVGSLGLMDAAKRFDPTKGVKFWSYASRRVLGEILDYMRDIYGREGRSAPKVRPMLDCDLRGANEEGDDAQSAVDLAPASFDVGDERVAKVRRDVLQRLLRGCPARAAEMTMAYLFDRKSMRVVGEQFGVTEARISQVVNRHGERAQILIERAVAEEAAVMCASG